MIPLVVASERGRAQTYVVVKRRRGSRTAVSAVRCERNNLESLSVEGDSPVREATCLCSGILSSAGHEKSCVNRPGPPGKAKYSRETDSEQVPLGKGEKHPDEGSEIVPEPVRLQAVGALVRV